MAVSRACTDLVSVRRLGRTGSCGGHRRQPAQNSPSVCRAGSQLRGALRTKKSSKGLIVARRPWQRLTSLAVRQPKLACIAPITALSVLHSPCKCAPRLFPRPCPRCHCHCYRDHRCNGNQRHLHALLCAAVACGAQCRSSTCRCSWALPPCMGGDPSR